MKIKEKLEQNRVFELEGLTIEQYTYTHSSSEPMMLFTDGTWYLGGQDIHSIMEGYQFDPQNHPLVKIGVLTAQEVSQYWQEFQETMIDNEANRRYDQYLELKQEFEPDSQLGEEND